MKVKFLMKVIGDHRPISSFCGAIQADQPFGARDAGLLRCSIATGSDMYRLSTIHRESVHVGIPCFCCGYSMVFHVGEWVFFYGDIQMLSAPRCPKWFLLSKAWHGKGYGHDLCFARQAAGFIDSGWSRFFMGKVNPGVIAGDESHHEVFWSVWSPDQW